MRKPVEEILADLERGVKWLEEYVEWMKIRGLSAPEEES